LNEVDMPKKSETSRKQRTASPNATNKTRDAKSDSGDPTVQRALSAQALAAAFPFNRRKADEIGDAARSPKPGATAIQRLPEIG
jgi:hypothetical protein